MRHYREGNNEIISTRKHLHKNDFWEMVYYINYDGVYVADNRQYPYQKNTLILTPPHITHYEFSPDAIEMYFLIFKPRYEHSLAVFQFGDYNNRFLESFFSQIVFLLNSQSENRSQQLMIVLDCLENYIFLLEQESKESVSSRLKRQISERYMDSSFEMRELLRGNPMSDWYQRKLFKADTGMTPTQYLNRVRIGYACSMLSGTTASIKSIALSSGFSDPYYFSRIFKSIKGENPSDWRVKHSTVSIPEEEDTFKWL